MPTMQDLKLSQLKHELETCKRLLNFISNENVHLKNRLSQTVKNNSEKNMLRELENYLTKFIVHDDLINLLKNDISKIEKRLSEKIHEDDEIVKDIYAGLQLIQSNILKTEALFSKLYEDFNNFLSEGQK